MLFGSTSPFSSTSPIASERIRAVGVFSISRRSLRSRKAAREHHRPEPEGDGGEDRQAEPAHRLRRATR